MIVIFVLLSIIAALLIYLFFAPFYIEINSLESLYRIRFHRLASISFFIHNDPSLMQLKFLFWKKEIDLFKQEQEKPTPEKKSSKKKTELDLAKIRTLIRSFEVTQCYITFDTGNMQWNGILYPIIYWFGLKVKKNISVNFQGKNILILEIRNSIAHLSRAYLSS